MIEQINMFDIMYEKYQIKKPIRLIELFAGYGSQALALKYLGIEFQHWKICEWATKSIQAYNDLHIRDYKDYSVNLTQNEIIDKLVNYGISMDYNEPMTYEQIKRKDEKWQRQTYNNIIATHNLVNIQNANAKDLNIVDTDKYDYILTYSFPCQDLSLAGKRAGMKDTSTRSGLLWEVERILNECEKLPQILVMENVSQVHSKGNKEYFQEWIKVLENLGYSSHWQDLNAKNYGIPQNRVRCFMISILGDYNYNFPKKIKLKKRLKDLLESEVDRKYFLSDKMISYISASNQKWTGNNNGAFINKDIASTINTGEGNRRCDASNYICDDLPYNFDLQNGCLKIKGKTKKGYAIANDGDGVYINRPHQKRGVVQKGMIQTIKTSLDIGVVVKDEINIIGNYSPSGHDASRIVHPNGIAPTVKENHGTITATVVNNDAPQLIGGIGEKKSNGGTQYYQQNRIYSGEGVAMCHPANLPSGSYIYGFEEKQNLRIRKLTPKECFRLMGVKDEDYEKIKPNQSESSLYHLAGDSICSPVLMAVFGELLNIDYQNKIYDLVETITKNS